METCLNYCNREHCFFSSDEPKFVRKIHKLKEQYPDDVKIIKEPDDNDGCIYCEIPVKWFSIKLPVKRYFTEEQKIAAANRLAKARKNSSVSEE